MLKLRTSGAIAKYVDRLFEACRSLDRGDILTHERIREILDIEPNEAHWQHCMNCLRKRIREERQIVVWPIYGVGFKFCTQSEHLGLGRERLLRAGRQARRGIKELDALPTENLSLHQQRLRSAMGESLRASLRQTQQAIRELAVTNRVTEVAPRPRSLMNHPSLAAYPMHQGFFDDRPSA